MAPKSIISIAALLSVAAAAPIQPDNLPRLPRTGGSSSNIADILPSDLTKLLSAVVDKLPVDAKVSLPVLPEKREANPAISVDLGGAGLDVKKRQADTNIADILPSDLTDLVSAILNKLPVDANVELPVLPQKRDPAIAVGLGGTGLTLKEREADPAINVDLGGAGVNIKKRQADTNIADILPSDVTNLVSAIVDKLPVDANVELPVLPQKRDPAIAVDLGGAGLTL